LAKDNTREYINESTLENADEEQYKSTVPADMVSDGIIEYTDTS